MFDIKISSEILSFLIKPFNVLTAKEGLLLDKIQMEIPSKDAPLLIRSTDLDTYLLLSSPCKVGSTGIITIPRESFTKILKSIKKDTEIRITNMPSGKVLMQYPGSKFEIRPYPDNSFPSFSFVKDWEFNNFVNASRFIKTLSAASRVIPDFGLQREGVMCNSCRFDFYNQGVAIMGTDGHRYTYTDMIDEGITTTQAQTVSLSEKAIDVLLKAFQAFNERYSKAIDKIYFFIEPNRIIFKIGEQILICPTLVKHIPNGGKPFSLEKNYQVRFNRLEVLDKLKQASAVLAKDETDLQLGFHEGKLFFRCKSKTVGQSLATILPENVIYQAGPLETSPLTKYINVKYLLEAISSFDSDLITFEWEAKEEKERKFTNKNLFIKNIEEDFYHAICIAGISKA